MTTTLNSGAMEGAVTAESLIAAVEEFVANPNLEGAAVLIDMDEKLRPSEFLRTVGLVKAKLQQVCERIERRLELRDDPH